MKSLENKRVFKQVILQDFDNELEEFIHHTPQVYLSTEIIPAKPIVGSMKVVKDNDGEVSVVYEWTGREWVIKFNYSLYNFVVRFDESYYDMVKTSTLFTQNIIGNAYYEINIFKANNATREISAYIKPKGTLSDTDIIPLNNFEKLVKLTADYVIEEISMPDNYLWDTNVLDGFRAVSFQTDKTPTGSFSIQNACFANVNIYSEKSKMNFKFENIQNLDEIFITDTNTRFEIISEMVTIEFVNSTYTVDTISIDHVLDVYNKYSKFNFTGVTTSYLFLSVIQIANDNPQSDIVFPAFVASGEQTLEVTVNSANMPQWAWDKLITNLINSNSGGENSGTFVVNNSLGLTLTSAQITALTAKNISILLNN
jgi:hypothetical protein